jgi:hypothetical protein
MKSGLDQVALPASVSNRKLADMARRGSAEPAATAALKELLRRQSPSARKLIDEVLVDPAASLEIRTTAARALGHKVTPGAESTLIAALDAKEPALQARAAESLGRIGGHEALDALAQVPVRPGAAHKRTINFARSLIAYRLGLDDARLRRPAANRVLDLKRGNAVQLDFKSVRPNTFRAAEPYLLDELPGIPVTPRGSMRFKCRQEHLWLVLTEEIEGSDATKRVALGSAVVAVLLKESHCPDSWYVYEYFLSHPRSATSADLFGVRPTGDLSHFGKIDIDNADAALRLQSINTPRLPAMSFQAGYRGRDGKLTIEEARVATSLLKDQKRPRQPRPDSPEG